MATALDEHRELIEIRTELRKWFELRDVIVANDVAGQEVPDQVADKYIDLERTLRGKVGL